MPLRTLLVASLLGVVACADPPAPPAGPPPASVPPPSAPPPPASPPPVAAPGTSAPAPGDERCPPGQFFVHGGCHTGDSVGIAGPP